MIALIALVVRVLITLVIPSAEAAPVMVIPPMPPFSPEVLAEEIETLKWEDFWFDGYFEARNEFNALFNSYEVKRAKNDALMIRRGNSGSFKFAKKG